MVATQEANPERFVLTNPEFKPIKASWQLAGFDDLSNEEQDLILRVLEGKTGVVTKRRLSSSILTRKLSFTGSKPSANLAADPVNVVEDATATKPSPDRVLPKIILRSPSKLNSEIKKEVVVKSPVKIAGEEIDTSALSAPSAGTITSVTSHSAINGNGASKLAKSPTKSMNSANGTPTSPSKITAKPVAIPIVNVASSPNKPSSVPLKSPSNGTTLNAVSAPGNPISPGTDLAANLLALKSPKKVSALPNSTTTINTSPKLSVTNPSLPKSPQKATNHLQSGFEMLSDSIQLQKKTGDESIPSAKRALSPNREFGEKKMRLD